MFQKAFGWEGGQSGGSPGGGGPQPGTTVAGQGAQGLVHWMSVMAEHMDPAVQHYMSWNQDVSTTHHICMQWVGLEIIEGARAHPTWTST